MDGLSSLLVHAHDVLVIGAGAAGLRAAIEARALGLDVGIVCKTLLGKAHSVTATGPLDARDDWKAHFRDTMRCGRYQSDWRMVRLLATEAPARALELEKWGAVLDPNGEGTGLEVLRTLQQHAVHTGLHIYMEHTITRLLGDRKGVTGAFGFRRDTGGFVAFEAKAIVLATGGAGRVFEVSSSSWESTGDGLALAYRLGAALASPELVQFHPLGVVWPPSTRGRRVVGDTAALRNAEGRAFVAPGAPDYVASRAIRAEVLAGRGSPHGGVYLGEAEVGPTAHSSLGGIRVDPDTQETRVRGLFAAGECASGVHGSHRLGENALPAALVFGRRAGKSAAEHAKKTKLRTTDRETLADLSRAALLPFDRAEGENPFAIHDDLAAMMQAYCGVVRNEPDLDVCLEEIARLGEDLARATVTGTRAYNTAWQEVFDLENLLLVAEAMTRAALARKESRGDHAREDFPEPDPSLANVSWIVRQGAAGMEVETMPLPALPEEIQAVLLDEELP